METKDRLLINQLNQKIEELENIINNSLIHKVNSCENCLLYDGIDTCSMYSVENLNLSKIPDYCFLNTKCVILKKG